ncbi:MAG: AAA family ATPase [Candidatus Diapherotrites archaeon]|nr:AAA family ATPase [Candidatus Diapherotrites archaeon]
MVLIAVAGMPGSGKSLAVEFFVRKGFERVYFGGIVVEETKKRFGSVSETKERETREALRKEHGMAAMAILSEPKLRKLVDSGKSVVIDDLMSWQELTFMREKFPDMILLVLFSSPKTRYTRLAVRKERPLAKGESAERDKSEIENLHKGGTLAMADYTIINETTKEELERELQAFFEAVSK